MYWTLLQSYVIIAHEDSEHVPSVYCDQALHIFHKITLLCLRPSKRSCFLLLDFFIILNIIYLCLLLTMIFFSFYTPYCCLNRMLQSHFIYIKDVLHIQKIIKKSILTYNGIFYYLSMLNDCLTVSKIKKEIR